MSEIRYYKDIIDKLKPKWKNKDILRAAYTKDKVQYKIRLAYLTKKDIYRSLEKINNWIEEIEKHSKGVCGYGYEIEYKELQGVGRFPLYALINSIDDAVWLLEKKKELKNFRDNSQKLLSGFPELSGYIYDNCFKVANFKNIDKLIAVLKWFQNNKNRNLYLRESPIKGVDTKFIENNNSVLKEILPIVLPDEKIKNSDNFSKMFGFKDKPNLVRFRVLDKKRYILNFSDITVPIEEFSQWENSFSKVFIVENEINFLFFPEVEDSIVIFGSGYKAGLLQKASWLSKRDVYYWGDIDTHGFSILSNLRKDIKNVKSFLMTEKVLLDHKDMWVVEEIQSSSEGKYLTSEEANLLFKLQTNYFGENVRLEQERIRYIFLEEYLKTLLK